jgi:hypothetical protein
LDEKRGHLPRGKYIAEQLGLASKPCPVCAAKTQGGGA